MDGDVGINTEDEPDMVEDELDKDAMNELESEFAALYQRFPRGCGQIQEACGAFLPNLRNGLKIPFFSSRLTVEVMRADEVEKGEADYPKIMELIKEHGTEKMLLETFPVEGGGNTVPHLMQKIRITYFGKRLWQWTCSIYSWPQVETGSDVTTRAAWMNDILDKYRVAIFDRDRLATSVALIACDHGFNTYSAILSDCGTKIGFCKERSRTSFNVKKIGVPNYTPHPDVFWILQSLDSEKLTYDDEEDRNKWDDRLSSRANRQYKQRRRKEEEEEKKLMEETNRRNTKGSKGSEGSKGSKRKGSKSKGKGSKGK